MPSGAVKLMRSRFAEEQFVCSSAQSAGLRLSLTIPLDEVGKLRRLPDHALQYNFPIAPAIRRPPAGEQ